MHFTVLHWEDYVPLRAKHTHIFSYSHAAGKVRQRTTMRCILVGLNSLTDTLVAQSQCVMRLPCQSKGYDLRNCMACKLLRLFDSFRSVPLRSGGCGVECTAVTPTLLFSKFSYFSVLNSISFEYRGIGEGASTRGTPRYVYSRQKPISHRFILRRRYCFQRLFSRLWGVVH